MDTAALKMMLESQERAYKSALDVVVKQMNDQMHNLQSKVTDLTTSLEFSQREIDDLKAHAKEQDKERMEDRANIEKLTKLVESSNNKIKELEEKVIYQEDYSRRKNLRISGLEEQGNETWEQTSAAVSSLLETKLQLPGVALERAHRVGPRRDSKPRTVVARFTRYSDRDAAIRRGSQLKGTNIYLNEDMSAASLAIKNAQMPLFKQARAEGKIAFFRHTKLIIRDKTSEDSASGSERRSTEISDAVDGSTQTAAGPAAGAGDAASGVVGVETAGAWTGRDSPRLSLSHQRADLRLPSTSSASSTQNRVGKKGLRSNTKK